MFAFIPFTVSAILFTVFMFGTCNVMLSNIVTRISFAIARRVI